MVTSTLALFVVSLGYGVIVPALPKIAGAGASELSVVYAGYAAAKIAAQVPGGVWVDRQGHGRVLGIALAVYVVSLLAFLAPLGPVYFTFIRALEGAATGLVYPAVFARVLTASDAASSGGRIGVTVGVGSSGLLAGPVLGAWLGKDGPTLPIAVAAALGAVVLALVVVLPSGAAPVRGPATRTIRGEVAALAKLAGTGAFVIGMLPIAFNKLTFSAYQGLLPLVGPDRLGADAKGVALLFVTIGVVFALAQPIAGALADRVPARTIVLASAPLLLGALLALSFTRSYGAFVALFGLHIFAQSIVFTATMKQAAQEHGTASTYGGVFGLLATLTDTMTIAGPLLFLNTYALAGGWTFAAMAAVGVVPTVIYGFRRR